MRGLRELATHVRGLATRGVTVRGVTLKPPVLYGALGAAVAIVAIVVALVVALGGSTTPTLTAAGDRPAGSAGAGGTGSTDPATPGPGESPGANPSPGPGDASTPGGSGGGGGGGGANAVAKPCSVVTTQDANQALGMTVQNTLDSDEECLYESGANAVMFSLKAEPFDAESVQMLQLLPGVEKLNGIGDAAFKVGLDQETQFHVWIKGKYVGLIVSKEQGDTAGPGRTLLDRVLTRI
jgi:hypothetical protein